MPRDEHPDRAFERSMTKLDEWAQREQERERIARHTPVPLADMRTGQVAIPTAWSTLCVRILDEQVPSADRIVTARCLAQLVLDVSEEGR